MTTASYSVGEYLIYKNTGIGRVLPPCPDRPPTVLIDGVHVEAISLEIVRFGRRRANGVLVVDQGVTHSVPLTAANLARLRRPLGLPGFRRTLRILASGEPQRITRRELLNHDFNVDFFNPESGGRYLAVLHDYMLHNTLDERAACREYAELYQHALDAVAFEASLGSGQKHRLLRQAAEVALFVGHQERCCWSCRERRPEAYDSLAEHAVACRSWIRSMVRGSGEAVPPPPESVLSAPVFLSPPVIEAD